MVILVFVIAYKDLKGKLVSARHKVVSSISV